LEKLVSIVIPVFNRVDLVSTAIECAINQTYKNIEIIIGDNCSTDGTWLLLQKYAKKDTRIHIFRNEENIGPVRNWKECINRANGKYVKILFSDDWMDNNWIEMCVHFFKNNMAFIYTPAQVEETTTKQIHYNKSKEFLTILSHNYVKHNIINSSDYPNSPGCALFRKKDLIDSIFLEIPNKCDLRHSINGAGIDKLIFLNIAIKYQYIGFVPYCKVYFLSHANSITVAYDLRAYYGTAIQYFLKKYDKSLWRKHNANLILQIPINYHLHIWDIDYIMLFRSIAKKLLRKIYQRRIIAII